MAKRTQSVRVHERLSEDLPINSRVAVDIVDDPYSTVGEKIQVMRSVRDDPLFAMLSRTQINRAQFEAGRLWQRLHEQSEVGSIRAIDPTKEAVDGGRMPEPITNRQIEAFRRLDEAHKWVGNDGYQIVSTVLGKRMSIKDAAELHGFSTAREFDYYSRRFRECLEALAKLWNFA